MTPLVSVVIPAYNAERYLAEAVESVFAQTYEPVEILIVNDGSTDRTEEIAHQVRVEAPPGKSVFVLSSAENQGAAGVLWVGFLMATGHYRTFLAADDAYVDPDHLARQVEAIQAAGADWSYYRDFSTGPTLAARRPITPVWLKTRRLDPIFERSNLLRFLMLFAKNPINSSSFMVEANAYRRFGGWNPAMKNADADRDLFFRYFWKGARCVVVPGPGPFYREHPAQLSRNTAQMREGYRRAERNAISLIFRGNV